MAIKNFLAGCMCMLASNYLVAQDFLKTDTAFLPALGIDGLRNSPKTFATFSARDLNGRAYSNLLFQDKVTFVNFWFEGCLPCMVEMEALNHLYTKYRANPSFQFISFTYEPPQVIRKIVDKYKIAYPVLAVSEQDIRVLNFSLGFPVSMIVNRTEQISFAKTGGFIEEDKAAAFFRSHCYKELDRVLQFP